MEKAAADAFTAAVDGVITGLVSANVIIGVGSSESISAVS